MLDDQQIRALAFLGSAARRDGARPWDQAGIVAAVTKVRHLPLADVMLAVARAADDSELNTPGPIANPHTSCWRERATASRPTPPPERISPTERCSVCGHPLASHDPADGHDPVRNIRQPRPATALTRLEYARQAVGDAKADNHSDTKAS